jgi:hypothetical protein
MREILEEALILYRQEAENLLFLASPAIIAGPILVLVSATGLTAALVCVLLILAVYLATYVSALAATGLVLASQEPDPVASYLAAFERVSHILKVALPGGLILGAAWMAGLIAGSEGFGLIGLAVGAAGAGMAFVWSAHRSFDLPLIVLHSLPAHDASELGQQLVRGDVGPTPQFAGVVASPLLVLALLSLALGQLLQPVFGGVLFAAGAAAWLPFAALAFGVACDRIVDEMTAARSRAA